MELLLSIVVAVAVVGLGVYPLLREARGSAALPEDSLSLQLEDLLAQRDGTYSAIKELEFEHQMGNMADRDFAELTSRYRNRAIGLLKQIDDLEDEMLAPPMVVEAAEVSGQQPRVADVKRAKASGQVAPWPTPAMTCGACGHGVHPGDRFCAICGSAIAPGCSECGAVTQPLDRFCSICGAPLQADGV